MKTAHTPGPWSQGITLSTRETRRWTQAQINENNARESLAVFAYFTDQDEGRGRKLVAQCETPDDAAFIVRACNSHDDLLAALEALLSNYADARQALAQMGALKGDGKDDTPVMQQARAAIVRATKE